MKLIYLESSEFKTDLDKLINLQNDWVLLNMTRFQAQDFKYYDS